MQVRKLFSYRKKMAEGKEPDIYVYDSLPNTLRNQIILIWRDAHHAGTEATSHIDGNNAMPCAVREHEECVQHAGRRLRREIPHALFGSRNPNRQLGK